MTLTEKLKQKVDELRKNKEAVKTIEKLQQERATQQEIQVVMMEYRVDEDIARRYTYEQHHKERVKAAVAKRNQTLRNIGSAITKGAAKAVEAQREQEKRKQARTKQKQKEEDEATWVHQT